VELTRPPLFGEHTQEVLSGLLGMSDAEIASLTERKILA
jgi:crotonobetainyl-CoA:carnitine CoA-transferase CaiB-like acyl-CoA transferase